MPDHLLYTSLPVKHTILLFHYQYCFQGIIPHVNSCTVFTLEMDYPYEMGYLLDNSRQTNNTI